MKKLIVLLGLILILTACAKSEAQLLEEGYVLNPTENGYVAQAALPAPVDSTKMYVPAKDQPETACTKGVYAASCSSVNVDNLDLYLNLDDVVYIDLRDYKDYAMKHFRNFESIPFFAYIFNAEANTNPEFVQLYGGTIDAPVSVYKESDAILEALFPQDKTLFIMCQSGGRVAMLMEILEVKGYDMSKVYNIGGMANYTDARFNTYLTNTGELTVDATYVINEVTRN